MRHPRTSLTLAVALATGPAACAAAGVPRLADPAERAAAGLEHPDSLVRVQPHAPAAPGERIPAGVVQYQTRPGTAFRGRNSAFSFGGEPPSIACTAGTTELFATANLDLPDGAAIRYVDTFAYDGTMAEDLRTFLISLCQSTLDPAPPVYTVHGDSSTANAPGDAISILDLSADPLVVDRTSCTYLLRARFATGTQCSNAIFLDKVRVGYPTP